MSCDFSLKCYCGFQFSDFLWKRPLRTLKWCFGQMMGAFNKTWLVDCFQKVFSEVERHCREETSRLPRGFPYYRKFQTYSKVRRFYSEMHPYTHSLDSTTDIFLWLFKKLRCIHIYVYVYHIEFIYHIYISHKICHFNHFYVYDQRH